MKDVSQNEFENRHSYLFVLSYGRSGSTLLQGALNNSPKILCSGENGNYLRHLYEAEKTLLKARDTANLPAYLDRPTQPFFGITNNPPANHPEIYRDLVRSLCLASCPKNKSPDFIGFKEIRYPWVEDLEDYLTWIDRIFLSPKFVLVTRELEDVINSGMYRELSESKKKQLLARFKTFETVTRQFVSLSSERTELAYGQIAFEASASARILNKIGLPVTENEFLAAQAKKHSF